MCSNPISATNEVLRIQQGSKDFFLFYLDFHKMSYFYIYSFLGQIYLGGKWAASFCHAARRTSSSATVGARSAKNWSKGYFFTLLTIQCGKIIISIKIYVLPWDRPGKRGFFYVLEELILIFDKQVLLKYIFEPAQLLSLYNGYLVSYIIAIDQI